MKYTVEVFTQGSDIDFAVQAGFYQIHQPLTERFHIGYIQYSLLNQLIQDAMGHVKLILKLMSRRVVYYSEDIEGYTLQGEIAVEIYIVFCYAVIVSQGARQTILNVYYTRHTGVVFGML